MQGQKNTTVKVQFGLMTSQRAEVALIDGKRALGYLYTLHWVIQTLNIRNYNLVQAERPAFPLSNMHADRSSQTVNV